MTKVRNPNNNFPVDDVKECKIKCVENCQCQAYSYVAVNSTVRRDTSTSTSLCWIWIDDLNDLQEGYENSQKIFVRVPKSDIGIYSFYKLKYVFAGTNLVTELHP